MPFGVGRNVDSWHRAASLEKQSATRERTDFYAGVDELDLELPIGNRRRLLRELIQCRLAMRRDGSAEDSR
jgi:hypothetical protein